MTFLGGSFETNLIEQSFFIFIGKFGTVGNLFTSQSKAEKLPGPEKNLHLNYI